MSLRPLVLLTPSSAAAVELPRRLASTGRALAGIYALKPLDLARLLAEPVLLGRGLAAWTGGHDALVAARLLAETGDGGLDLPQGAPRAPVAAALARTLAALRRAGIEPARVAALADSAGATPDDARRIGALARLYAGYHERLEGRVADPVSLIAAAREGLARARWLDGALVLIADDLELEPDEIELVKALAARLPVQVLRRPLPPSLRQLSFRGLLAEHGVREVAWSETPLAAAAPPEPGPALARLREGLFEPPRPVSPSVISAADTGVELVTAAGEAAEVRSIARRLLREAARGVPFEEMGVVLPRPETYAPLFTDLLTRLGVPHRLHPSLPLRFGRAARSLLLLFRCRGLERPAVMEFLTFAPIPFEAMLGAEVAVLPARWDQISREAGIVSGYSRWMLGLRAWSGAEREAAEAERDADRRERRLEGRRGRRGAAPDPRVPERSARGPRGRGLLGRVGRAPAHARRPVARPGARQGGRAGRDRGPRRARLGRGARAVERGRAGDRGALRVGAPAARAARRRRRARGRARRDGGPAVPRGRDPGPGRRRLPGRLPPRPVPAGRGATGAAPSRTRFTRRRARRSLVAPAAVLVSLASVLACRPARSLSPARLPARTRRFARRRTLCLARLFDAASTPGLLPTSQDRLLEARRLFHRAVSQASERLILSYPRADARSGRERLPSLFFAAAAATLAGRPVAGAELDRMVVEDDPRELPLEDAVDAGERDRLRVLRDDAAAAAIAAGSPFFQHSRLASQARWSGKLTRYDGLVSDESGALAAKLDPLNARHPVSASRLALYARCGFQYLLQHVLHLQPAPEPEERRRIDPLERGRPLPSRGRATTCASAATAASCRSPTRSPPAPVSPRWPRKRSRDWSRAARRASRCSGSARSAASTRRCGPGSRPRRVAPDARRRRTSSSASGSA